MVRELFKSKAACESWALFELRTAQNSQLGEVQSIFYQSQRNESTLST